MIMFSEIRNQNITNTINLMERTILTPTNLFYRLKEMMNIISDRLPEHRFSNREVWSQETENTFNNFQQSFRKDLEKANNDNEPRDDLDRAQDIFEFHEDKEWTEEDELCDFCCNRARLDGFYYFQVKEIIDHPRLKWKVRALNGMIKMKNDWFRFYPIDFPF